MYTIPKARKYKKHQYKYTPEYKTWSDIKARCYNTENGAYNNYGGRGIKMWSGWIHDPVKFCKDVGNRPTPHHTIDRIDNNGNYEPGNLRWATRTEQNINRRTFKNNKVGFRGVCRDGKKYLAKIGYNKARIHLGRFNTLEEAALAYDCAAIQLHGELATTNLL